MVKKYENYVDSGTTLYIVGGWDPDYYWQTQAFTLGNVSTNESFKVTNIKIKAYRAGTPGKLTVSIRETDGQGVPTGNDLCVGYTDADSLPTIGSYEWRIISFEEPVILNPSQQYALVFRVENLENAVYLFGTSSGTYSGGDEHFSSDSGGNWEQNSSDEDIYFEIWGYKTKLYEHANAGNPEQVYNLPYGTRAYCQTFTLGTNGTNLNQTINSIKLRLKKTGTPTGNFDISLRATDSNGKPTGIDLSNGSLPVSSISTTASWIEFPMSPHTLLESNKYSLVFRVPDGDEANSIMVLYDTDTYSGGQNGLSNDGGVNWTMGSSADFSFEIWSSNEKKYSEVTWVYPDEITNEIQGENWVGQTFIAYNLDENYSPICGTKYPFHTTRWVTQTFTTDNRTGRSLVSIKLHFFMESGYEPGNVLVSLKATDVDGKPTGSDLSTGSFNADLYTAGGIDQVIEIPMSAYSLSANTKYAIVLQTDTGTDNLISMVGKSGSNYSGGSEGGSTDSGANWTMNTGDDAHFEIYVTSNNLLKYKINRIRFPAWYDATADSLKDVELSIRAVNTSSGNPTGSDLTYGRIDGMHFDAAYNWKDMFLEDYEFQTNTKYAIILRVPYATGSNNLLWSDESNNPHPAGKITYSTTSGSTWTTENTSNDCHFQVWGESAEFLYNGVTPLTIVLSNTNLFEKTYNGTNSLTILPVGEYFQEINYLYDGNINFTLLPSYSSALEREYNGLTTITLLPNGEYSLIGLYFSYAGNVDLTLLPSYSSLFDRDYDGQMNITILPVGEYSLISRDFVYDGNINMIILPSYQSILEGIYSGQINLIITPSAIYSLSGTGEHIYSGNIPVELLPSYSSILEGIYNGLTQITILPISEYSLITTERTYNGLVNFILTLSSVCVAPPSTKRYGRLEPKPYQNISIVRAMNEIRRGLRNRVVD